MFEAAAPCRNARSDQEHEKVIQLRIDFMPFAFYVIMCQTRYRNRFWFGVNYNFRLRNIFWLGSIFWQSNNGGIVDVISLSDYSNK